MKKPRADTGPIDTNGRLNMTWLRRADPDRISKWLWHHFFANPNVDSTSSYIEYIFQREPLESELRFRIEELLISILKQFPSRFSTTDPKSHAPLIHGVGEILRLCYQWSFSSRTSWFHQQLQAFCEEGEESWPQELRVDVLFAISRQYPGDAVVEARELWTCLLQRKEYATVALFPGLARSFEMIVQYLSTWHATCSSTTRLAELSSLVEIGFEELGKSKAIEILLAPKYVADFSEALKQELNEAFESLNCEPLFLDAFNFRNYTRRDLRALTNSIKESVEDPRDQHIVDPALKTDWPLEIVYSDTYPESDYLRGIMDKFRESLHRHFPETKYKVRYVQTDNFEQARKTGLVDRNKAIFCAPYLLTADKRSKQAVIQFGWHRSIGLLTRNLSIRQVVGSRPLRQTNKRDNVQTIAFDKVFSAFLHQNSDSTIFSPEFYSIVDVVREGLEYGKLTTHDRAKIEPTTDPVGKIPEKVISENQKHDQWCYAFDLGHYTSIEKHLQELKGDKRWEKAIIIRVTHDLRVPVGIGFTLYTVPLLRQDDLWLHLYGDLRRTFTENGVISPEFIQELSTIGVVPGEPHEFEGKLPSSSKVSVIEPRRRA